MSVLVDNYLYENGLKKYHSGVIHELTEEDYKILIDHIAYTLEKVRDAGGSFAHIQGIQKITTYLKILNMLKAKTNLECGRRNVYTYAYLYHFEEEKVVSFPLHTNKIGLTPKKALAELVKTYNQDKGILKKYIAQGYTLAYITHQKLDWYLDMANDVKKLLTYHHLFMMELNKQ